MIFNLAIGQLLYVSILCSSTSLIPRPPHPKKKGGLALLSLVFGDIENFCHEYTLVEMHPKSLNVAGMFLARNMQGFGMFAMHVCMLCACNMHTTYRDFECFRCMLHVTCIQHYTHNTVTCMFL